MTRLIKSTVALMGLIGGACLQGQGAAFEETFTTDPSARGWFATGQTNLFHWNSAKGGMDITWDSREANSYFAHPLGMVLTRTNDFSVVFDLKLADFMPNIDPAFTNGPLQIAVGLINLSDATGPGFSRPVFGASSNLVDFGFFPDPGGTWEWGSSLSSVIIDDTGYGWVYSDAPKAGFSTGDVFRVTMTCSADDLVLRTTVLRNGLHFASLIRYPVPDYFSDFAVDHLAVCSYSGARQNKDGGSILAHGTVDNLSFAPWLPVKNLTAIPTASACAVRFDSHATWLYTLERTTDWLTWDAVSPALPGTDTPLTLTDPSPPASRAFYRVRADKP